MSTPLDLESAAFLSDVVPAFKVASGDNNFVPLLKQIASSDKSVILSTGLMTVDEIQGAMETIRTCWKEHGFEQDLAVLHCISAYPAEPASTNLAAIATLRDALDCTVGYSDHTLGCDAAVLSVALGARIVEKHFTIDHQHSDFRDHQLSADPAELKDLVERIRQAEVLMGSGEKKPCQQEADIMPQIRRSIVAAHDLSAGTVLSLKDLCWIRPFDGLAPGNEDRVIGKALDRDIQAGDPITEDMLK